MATTSTNKQPLLVDRVFHNHVPADRLNSGSEKLDIIGANSSKVIVDCSTNDGGIIEELYVISRGLDSNGEVFVVNFYISPSTDFLRADEAVFIGQVTASDIPGEMTTPSKLPRVLAPLPCAGTESQVGAYYVPRGKVIWATLQQSTQGMNSRKPSSTPANQSPRDLPPTWSL